MVCIRGMYHQSHSDYVSVCLVRSASMRNEAGLWELYIPELQRRGIYRTSHAEGTMREKLFGRGGRVPASHPAAGYQRG